MGISEEDIKAATQVACFPGSLAFAELLDMEYFGEASSDSSDSDSELSNPPCNPPSPSRAGSEGSSESDSEGDRYFRARVRLIV